MKYYLITDTHFNHDKVIEYCGRPTNFESIIFKNLSNILPEDILIHLGDVCIGRDEEMHAKYIQPLQCKKWLIKGNHDKKSNTWYLTHGWDFVAEQMIDTIFGKKILFSHIPQKDIGEFDINIHGHFHNSDHRRYEPELAALLTDKHKLLAIEYTKYSPVLLNNFLIK